MSGRRAERTLRIIGGTFRSRKVSFPDREEIRPTPDRVRETLFNWLQSDIAGATCLELYAGSGLLSMEALSRGAKHTTLIEQDPVTFGALAQNLAQLDIPASRVSLHQGDAVSWLNNSAASFDIVFLDPPFHQGAMSNSLAQLTHGAHLKPGALIYVEQESPLSDGLEAHFKVIKEGRAGQVHYGLLQVGDQNLSRV